MSESRNGPEKDDWTGREVTDRDAMVRAIQLARYSVSEKGKVSPKVGAVVVRDGRIIGEGYRGEITPGDHAEFTVLEKKLRDATLAGATIITTLEPCIVRKGPTKLPCVERIKDRQIAKVVIGVLDPNGDISGKGWHTLTNAGIDVEFFPPDLVKAIMELNRDFNRQHWPPKEAPKEERPTLPDTERGVDDPRTWYRLSSKQRTTYEELQRQSESLAGLFFYGLLLAARADQAGVPILVAHAGSELCEGVVNLLSGTEAVPDPSGATATSPGDQELFANRAGKAFDLDPTSEIVSEWEVLRRYFVDVSRLRRTEVMGAEVADKFRRLTELIYGVTAPFVVMHQELQRLLDVEVPSDKNVSELGTILSRPALRRLFFGRLQHSGWVEKLNALGVFASPPARKVLPDGRWSLVAWPEGEYLARIAGQAPRAVTAILSRIPLPNDNPVVWEIVAQASLEVPYDSAQTELLTRGIKALPFVVIDENIRKVARRGAAEHDDKAFDLLQSLLSVSGRFDGRRDSFARLENYSASRLLSEDLGPFLDYDGLRLLRALLARMYQVVEREREAIGETGYRPPSRLWIRDLSGDISRAEGGREAIVLATASVAAKLMARSETDARDTYRLLSRAKNASIRELEERIRYFALSRGSPHLVAEVDRLVTRPGVLSASPKREIGEVLRRRMEEASPDAQDAFLRNFKRGPDSSELWGYTE